MYQTCLEAYLYTLNDIHAVYHLILMTVWGRYQYYSHFIDEETETQNLVKSNLSKVIVNTEGQI